MRTERVKRLFQKTKVIITVLLKYMKQLWINFYSFKLVLGYVRWLGARRFVYVLLLLFVSLLLYAVCSLDLAHCVLPSALFLTDAYPKKYIEFRNKIVWWNVCSILKFNRERRFTVRCPGFSKKKFSSWHNFHFFPNNVLSFRTALKEIKSLVFDESKRRPIWS